MAKTKQTATITLIQLSTGFSERFKKQLDSLDIQDLRPLALTQWARKTFAIGRDDGLDDSEIAPCVRTYAEDRNYSERQIQQVMQEAGLSTYDSSYRQRKSADSSVYQTLETYKRFVKGVTEMQEIEIQAAGYSPQKIRRLAHDNLLDWISHMSEADLLEFQKWMTLVDVLVQDALKILEQKKVSPKYGR